MNIIKTAYKIGNDYFLHEEGMVPKGDYEVVQVAVEMDEVSDDPIGRKVIAEFDGESSALVYLTEPTILNKPRVVRPGIYSIADFMRFLGSLKN